MVRMRFRPPRWLLWTGAPVLLVLLLLAAGVGYLRTEAGGRLLGRELAAALGSATGSTVEIAAVEGAIPFAIELRDARFAAEGRTWLTLGRLAVAWNPWALLGGRLEINALTADEIALSGLPPPGPAPEPTPGPPSLAIELPKLPLAVTVDVLHIGRLALGAEVVGTAVALRIDGHARIGADIAAAELQLDAERIDGTPGSIRLSLGRAADSADLSLRLAVEEPAGGLVARTLAVPGLPAVKLTLAGDGPVGDWRGKLAAEAGTTQIAADLGLGLGPTGRFQLQGTARLAGLLDAASAPLVPDSLAFAAAAEWQPGRRLAIDSLTLTAPEGEVTLKGEGDLAKDRIQGTLAVRLADPKRWAKLLEPAALKGLRLDARIEGPLRRPDLAIEASADRLAASPAAIETTALTLRGRLTLDEQWRPVLVSLIGETRLDGLTVPGEKKLEALIGPKLTGSIDADLQLVKGDGTIRRLEVETKGNRLTAEGTIGGFGKTSKLKGQLSVADLAGAAALGGLPLQGKGDLGVTIAGDLLAPAVEIGIDARLADLKSGDPQTAALLGATPTLTASAAYANDALDLKTLKLDGAGLAITASGRADIAKQSADMKASGRIADLAPFSPLLGMGVKGSLAFDAQAVGDAGKQGVRTTLAAALDGFAIDQPQAKPLLGERVTLDLTALLQGDTLRLEKAALQGADLAVTASGRVLPTLELGLSASLPRLAPLGQSLGTQLDGPAKLDARLTGSPEHPALNAEVTAGPLTVEGNAIKRLRASAEASDLTAAPQGKLRLETEAAGTNGTLATDYRLNADGSLALDRLKLTLPGSEIAGDLVVLPTGLARGKIAGTVSSLEPLGKILGRSLAGAVKLDLTLAASNGSQNLEARIDARNLALDAGSPSAVAVGQVTATARLGDLLRQPSATIEVKAERATAAELSLASARLTANGSLAALKLTADLDGNYRRPFTLAAAGDLAREGPGMKLRLDRLTAKHGQIATRLAAPATLSFGGEELGIAGLDLRIGTGKLVGDGRVGPKAVGLKLALSDLPLALLRDFTPTADLDGTAAADIAIEGSPARPTARAELRLRGVREKGGAAKSVPPLDAVATLGLRDGKASLAAKLGGPKELALEAQAELPATLTAAPLAFTLAENAPISGTVKGRLDLGLIPRLIDLRGDRLAGALDIDMTLAGTLDAPRISGETRVVNGSYRSAEAGTVLRDITASLSGDAEKIVLRSLSANDGDGGQVSANASVALAGTTVGAIKGEIKLANFAVLRRDDATARMSGTVNLDQGSAGTRVKGGLTVDSAELLIPEKLPPQVVKLQVKEIHGPAAAKAPPPAAKPAAGPDLPIKLDLTVDVPGRAFVRGRGIVSEWRGRFAIGGTAAAPDLIGDLQVVRGTVDAVGHVFQVTSGTITFVGGGAIDPELDLTAVAETKDVTAKVHVTGRASEPKIELGSDSGLPQEEVLSRLLFGKSAGGLSPAQALQLAQAVASLAGGGGGSVLDDIRRGVGLDVLRVESGEKASDTSLQAGKYVSDDVYLKVEQGLTPESRRVGVEVRVLPRITVEGDVGAQGSSRVGVKWRYDY